MMNPIRYMAHNHVAANILMLVIMAGGLVALRSVKVEVFPETTLDMVQVQVLYPGAAPEEVEEGIVRPVEEAVHGLDGVKRVTATAAEGMGSVMVEVLESADVDQVLQDVKSAVDRIITFPQEAERPVVQKLITRRQVLSVVVYGDMDPRTLRQRAEAVRDQVLALPEVTQAELSGVPPWEISIEVKEEALRRYGLTLPRVAAAVRAASMDLPGGSIKARGGEILLRTRGKRYYAREYRDLVVLARPNGTRVRLGDLATVRDKLAETDEKALFDGKPAAMVQVYRVGDQTPLDISRAVKAYVARQRATLPPVVKMAVWDDRSETLRDRMDLLLRNAAQGLLLVVVVLGLFLHVRLAFWVTLGIPLSFLGAVACSPWLGVSINMISLFAFILVLGIVVDDAIVVGENVFHYRARGLPLVEASVKGATEVGSPVIFSVLTTVAAFAPLLFISGMMGKFMRNIPIIVIAVLLVSLTESLLVLPAHLARSKPAPEGSGHGPLGRLSALADQLLEWTVRGPYRRTLRLAVAYRYASLALALALLLLTGGIFAGKHLKFIFMPEVEGDVVRGKITMPFGTPVEETERHLKRMIAAARQVVARHDATMPKGESIMRNMYASLGATIPKGGPKGGTSTRGAHLGEMAVYLRPSDQRNVESEVFAREWREAFGEVPGAEAVQFDATIMKFGDAVDIQLGHESFQVLEAAAARVKAALARYPGVFDIRDSHEQGKRELKLRLRPGARALGVSEQELATQVRGAFYGAEALRLQRGRNEVKVMVRYPRSERRSLADIREMRIRPKSTTGGSGAAGEVPLEMAASITEGRGYSVIHRADRKRVLHVTASVNYKVANPDEILAELRKGVLPQLVADYPGLSYDLEGQQRERRESMASLKLGFLMALVLIYALLAIPFRSYVQPILIMSAIPFGLVGAVLGHLVMGYNMSLMSIMGIVAMTGVVVNDSLVMIDFINRNRRGGMALRVAVMEAGARRFRPIMLTTVTTVFALLPILTETSVQARFLVPMAISLAFGVGFSTLITLVLVPVLYMILEDARGAAAWVLGGRHDPDAMAE